jgi:hypothetical protein
MAEGLLAKMFPALVHNILCHHASCDIRFFSGRALLRKTATFGLLVHTYDLDNKLLGKRTFEEPFNQVLGLALEHVLTLGVGPLVSVEHYQFAEVSADVSADVSAVGGNEDDQKAAEDDKA